MKYVNAGEILPLDLLKEIQKYTSGKIVYSKRISEQLIFQPKIESAKEYDENGLLEEWAHTYLLFERKNKPFSDGLYLEERYFIGPVSMPLCLFKRSSGPEKI